MTRCVLLVMLLSLAPGLRAADYHVDCGSGRDSADGASPASAWGSLERVNAFTFQPGDSVRLRRGTTCEGALWPKGSGQDNQPIVLGAYGEGPLPVVRSSGQTAAVKLFNQHHWEIRDLEVTGSSEFGIHISGSQGVLRQLRVIDCVIHGVHSKEKMRNKVSGLLVVEATQDQIFEDVLIDGVTAFDTNRWSGIVVVGRGYTAYSKDPRGPRSRLIAIRNSIVHDVYGDGIILFTCQESVIERSAAWYTGLEPSYSIGTPNGIWTWTCADCIVRQTEGFFADSPGVDGGVYDIDWGNDRNLVEDNYGHDSQAYCVAIFGAEGVTTESEIRGNVCAGNGRSPRLARHHGNVHLTTWSNGSLDGVLIRDNIFLWNPPIAAPAVKEQAEFSGTRPNRIENNLALTGEAWLSASHPERLSVTGNRIEKAEGHPLLALPEPGPAPAELAAAGVDLEALRGSVALVSLLDGSADSRGQAVVLRSAAAQYGKGLAVIGVSALAPGSWALEGVRLERAAMAARLPRGSAPAAQRWRRSPPTAAMPVTFLLDRQGRLLYRWQGYAPAKEVVFAVRKVLGPPAGVNQ